MEQQKKRNRLISLVIGLLILAALVMPLNTQEVSAITADLQNPQTASDGTVTWDCVYFGHYPQGSYQPTKTPTHLTENEIYTDLDGTQFVYIENPAHNMGHYYKIEPIKWRVLSVNQKEVMLLADKNLDVGIPYNVTETDVTWETCSMRSWLNGYDSPYNIEGLDYTQDNFMEKAFTAEEREAVLEKTIRNEDNWEYGTDGGNDTKDKVFLLSIREISTPAYGFPTESYPQENGETREALNTAYKSSRNSNSYREGDPDWYWLRSPGGDSKCAAYISLFGLGVHISHYGDVGDIGLALRPAIFLDINAAGYIYGGTINSKGVVGDKMPDLPTSSNPETKQNQNIAVANITKTYGNKAFSLGAKAKTKLTYKSSNKNVATVSSTGKVTLKGPGKATITITAAATNQYNAATKKITIIVKPKKVTGLKAKKGKKRMTVRWKRDSKATGYQITYAQNKKFKKSKSITISKNKTVKKTVKKLKAKKTYYVKIRTYKKVGKMKIYGAYSKTRKVKVN